MRDGETLPRRHLKALLIDWYAAHGRLQSDQPRPLPMPVHSIDNPATRTPDAWVIRQLPSASWLPQMAMTFETLLLLQLDDKLGFGRFYSPSSDRLELPGSVLKTKTCSPTIGPPRKIEKVISRQPTALICSE